MDIRKKSKKDEFPHEGQQQHDWAAGCDEMIVH